MSVAMKPPLCWITNAFDRSPSEMLWVSGDGWGPLKGSLLNFSYGNGFYHHHLSWADDLTVPFAALPRYVEQIAAGEDLTRPTERLAEEL